MIPVSLLLQDSHDRETYETCPKCDYNTTKTEKMDKHMRKAHEMVRSQDTCSTLAL